MPIAMVIEEHLSLNLTGMSAVVNSLYFLLLRRPYETPTVREAS